MSRISLLQASDYEQWLEIFRGYAAFYKVSLSEAGLAATWGWLMDDLHPLTGIGARDESGLIGIAHFRAMPSPRRGQEIGFLDDLFVTPDKRGCGIADQLLEALKEHAVSRGWAVVRWITSDNNYRARGVYDRHAAKSDWNTYEMFCS